MRVMVSDVLTIGRVSLHPVNRAEYSGLVMDSFTRVPVTLAAIAAMTVFLSGCIAVDAASDVVDVGASVVTTTGDIVTSPFDGDDADNTKKH
jgi:hypothetical protein